jgi:hypothetical protein
MTAIMTIRRAATARKLHGRARRRTAADNFFKCDKCDGWFDARDLAWVEDQEGALPHPAMDQPQ